MTLTYFNDINVYFHMKNHYKMLKNVKSVIDTSIPQSLLKSPMATSSLDKRTKGATNEHLRKIYNTDSRTHMLRRRGVVKKHNCLNSGAKSEVSLSLPSRPSTRRNPSANPEDPFPTRSFSMGPFAKAEKLFKFKQKKRSSVTSTRSSNSEDPSANLPLELQQDIIEGNELETPPNSQRSNLSKERNISRPQSSCSQASKSSFVAKSSEEQEYLLFLLRITEDIISNDFYSNNDIRRIFKTHVDLNKNRLNMRKMHLHIANLCRELNIDCKEYEMPECVDETDSVLKFQNSPRNSHSRTNILNNEAFKSCQDCSAIRSSSLYKIHNTAEDNCTIEDSFSKVCIENIGDGAVISPSLLRLLEKLSLGRVTECTEPVASTSTMNSPKFNVPNTEELNNTGDHAIRPLDFDTFIKELNSKETVSKDTANNEADLTSESPPAVINMLAVDVNNSDETDIPKSSSSNLEMKIVSPPDIEVLKTPVHFTKSDIELSLEKEASIASVSEKYESEFEKCSSNDSMKTMKNTPEKDSSNFVKDNDKRSQVETSHVETNETSVSDNKLPENVEIPVLIKEVKLSPDIDPKLCLENEMHNVVSSKPSTALELKKVISDTDLDQLLQKDYLGNQENVKKWQAESSTSPTNVLTENKETNISDKDAEFMAEEKSVSERNKNINETNEDHLKNSLKLILQGTVKEEDYVLIKGPVFVYKPLLESEPKLIVFNNDGHDQTSRADSPNSQHSHKTFTVDNRHVLDQSIQYDTSLHSAEVDRSMENILQLTKAAYNQFMDLKLLESDYDLTPEKDYSDNKYHYLMADATTSISGLNITESLLLNDDYLVKNEATDSNVELDGNTANDIDSYLKHDSKMYENNYVIHRKLVSSVSMPKLKLGGGSIVNSGRDNARRNENLKTGNILRKCSSDLITFDVPSQDSSLRSEGEAEQNIHSTKRSMPWNR